MLVDPPHLSHRPLGLRIATFIGIVSPFLVVLAVPFVIWDWGFYWTDLWLLLAMYLLTALGITIGFHRLFVHRSFDTYLWMKFVWAVLGSMAVQGSLFRWVARHRCHHQHTDTADDPHSPHHSGEGITGILKGLWHAHIGWLFEPEPPNLARYVTDLQGSRALKIANNLFPLWVVIGLLIPAIFGGIITGTGAGFITGLVWGGFVRVFLVHHVTWSVNSACHLWGRQPYKSNDESRNNFVFGILALGEGWHNNHHAFPSSARHGLRWWQIDVSYWIIRLLAELGLVWNVKLPARKTQFEKQVR